MALRARLSKRAILESSGGGAAKWAEILALAKPAGVINLGQGFPDFPGHEAATIGARAALEAGKHDQYSPIPGSARLCSAVSALYQRMYPDTLGGRGLDPANEVTVMTSGTEALFCAVLGIVDPGDEVVFFEPFFPWYLPCIRLAGGVPVPVRLKSPNFDFLSSEKELRAAFSSKTKLCIVNTPHNPTGHCSSVAENELVAKLCREFDTICLSDEVYEACMFEGNTHHRISAIDGMWDRTLTIGSASKLLSLTGWRVGWATGPEELVKAARTMHAYTTFCSPSPLQEGVAAALEAEVHSLHFEGRAQLIHGNFELLAKTLRATGVEVCPAQGGYFLVADVSSTGMSDMEYCVWLAQQHKVAAMPLSVFYSPTQDAEGGSASEQERAPLIRFAVCKERSTIESACAALAGATAESARAAKEAL